jgi:hypothetical protein
MSAAEASRTLDLLAALSHHANFAIGCYCEDESRCHRSVLRSLLEDRARRSPDAGQTTRSLNPGRVRASL